MKENFLNLRFQKAFTLIEILLITSIIFILTGVVLLNYRTRESQLALQRSQNKLAQDFRQARDLAMNTKEFKQTGQPPEIPQGGYGIYIESSGPDVSSYLIYADLNGNEMFDGEPSDGIVDCDLEKDTKLCNLEKNIFIKSISPAPLSINFLAPDPEVEISSGATSATIILAIKSDPNNSKTITINKLGLITIE